MVPGFNTDFKYRGMTFHVQTEDNGSTNPVVVSLLYYKGAILASRKTSYRELLERPDCSERLLEMMKAQHKTLMRELLAGAYDSRISPAHTTADTPPVASPPAPEAPTVAAQASRVVAATAPGERTPAPALIPPNTVTAIPTVRPSAPRCGAVGLDEAIMHYLEEYAAAAAAS